ncbi:MAG TPA: glycosyltransferase family 39 protein [Steroidobacteraceae bacterium]
MTESAVASSRGLAWLLALLVVVAFAFQGTRGIWEPDEGRYTSAGVNMHENGDWLVPTLDGEHAHLTKPPMTYWAIAASFALLGHNEWAARLPSALAYIGTGLLVFGLGRRLCATRPWLPAFVWATSFAPAIAANVVSTDPILVLFESAAMLAFVEAWSREGPGARRWYLLMWLGWALAFMTKGPPALLPLLGMVLFLAIHDRSRLRPLFLPAGLALFVVVGFAWFAVVVAQQPDRLGYFFGYEVYDRMFTPAHDRNAEWYGGLEVYGPMLLFGTLPWSLVALFAAGGPGAAWRGLRTRLRARRADDLLLVYWVLVPLLVLFLARSRLHLYVLPLFVPLALVMARGIAPGPKATDRRLAWIVGATAVVLVGFKAFLAYWPYDRDAREFAAQLERLVDPHSIEEVVFVGMRPFYGLNVYIDRHIEGIDLRNRRFDYSRFVGHQDVCSELAERERSVYGMRQKHVRAFLAATGRCGGQPRLLGKVHADGHDIVFFLVPPAAPPPGISG